MEVGNWTVFLLQFLYLRRFVWPTLIFLNCDFTGSLHLLWVCSYGQIPIMKCRLWRLWVGEYPSFLMEEFVGAQMSSRLLR
jgi:hypothetical protein